MCFNPKLCSVLCFEKIVVIHIILNAWMVATGGTYNGVTSRTHYCTDGETWIEESSYVKAVMSLIGIIQLFCE